MEKHARTGRNQHIVAAVDQHREGGQRAAGGGELNFYAVVRSSSEAVVVFLVWRPDGAGLGVTVGCRGSRNLAPVAGHGHGVPAGSAGFHGVEQVVGPVDDDVGHIVDGQVAGVGVHDGDHQGLGVRPDAGIVGADDFLLEIEQPVDLGLVGSRRLVGGLTEGKGNSVAVTEHLVTVVRVVRHHAGQLRRRYLDHDLLGHADQTVSRGLQGKGLHRVEADPGEGRHAA